MRDPRKDPQVGDIIKQRSGDLVRVTAREGNTVYWDSKRPKGRFWRDANSWTIGGWENNVCDQCEIVTTT